MTVMLVQHGPKTKQVEVGPSLPTEFPTIFLIYVRWRSRYQAVPRAWNRTGTRPRTFCARCSSMCVWILCGFFYKGDREHTETDGSFFRHVTLSEYTCDELEGLDGSLLSGVEEPILSTSIRSELWRDLGVRRVVKITGLQARIGKERAYSELQGSSTDRDQVERLLQFPRPRPGSA
jgi:hypothetical protein